MSGILFFRSDCESDLPRTEDSSKIDDLLEVWRPTLREFGPPGTALFPFCLWWVFHWTKIFGNDGYRIFLLKDHGELVHRSCLFPPYFRFPFMRPNDMQVGDIWTAESRRGKGMAAEVLRQILRDLSGIRVWYLCESENIASVRLARSAGMTLYAVGLRTSKWGMSLFGRFEIQTLV